MRNPGSPFKGCDRRSGDITICPCAGSWQSDLKFIGNCLDTSNPFGHMLSRPLLGEARDKASQRHDSILYGDLDVGCIDTRFPIQFFHNILLQLGISLHGHFLLGC
jgi:hypothetical protein